MKLCTEIACAHESFGEVLQCGETQQVPARASPACRRQLQGRRQLSRLSTEANGLRSGAICLSACWLL